MTCSNHHLLTNHINSEEGMIMEPYTRQNSTTQPHRVTVLLHGQPDSHCPHVQQRPSYFEAVHCGLWAWVKSALLHGEVCIETQDHMHYQNWVGPGPGLCVYKTGHTHDEDYWVGNSSYLVMEMHYINNKLHELALPSKLHLATSLCLVSCSVVILTGALGA